MRSLCLALLVALALVLGPSLVTADEPPAKPPATDEEKPDAKADEKKPDEKKPDEEEAEELAPPAKAYSTMRQAANKLPYAKRSAHMKQAAEMYLMQWQGAGKQAEGDEHFHIGLLQQNAELWAYAAKSFAAACASKGILPNIANSAANAEARLYTNPKAREAIGDETAGKALKRLLTHAASISDESMQSMRGAIETTVASALDAMDQKQEAHDLRIAVAERDPTMVGRVYRSLIWGMLGKSHSIAGYERIRKQAEPVLAMLKTQQAKAIEIAKAKAEKAVATLKESNPDAVDENGNLTNTDNPRTFKGLERVVYNAKRGASGAERLLTRIDGMNKPFTMLGQPVPTWTLEHAFGETKAMEDLKGKVVVMDFWATWCGWCVRSFPAIRQILREYEEKGLVFVGITASSSSVYPSRYDLDDDLKHKGEAGARPKRISIARGGQEPDGETTFSAEDYKTKEREVIAEFIKNHEMTWPVVMIDKTEPGPKYALGGWPHAVVVDRAGRVRYFKSGALLLDRKEAYAKFKKVLEDLLAEKAP